MDTVAHTSWEFLINSDLHKNYFELNLITGISSKMSLELQESDSSKSYSDGRWSPEKLSYSEPLKETLDPLHAVYESLKLDYLRKKDLGLLVVLLCNVANFLGERSYLDHYVHDFPGISKKLEMCKDCLSQTTPPRLFRWLEHCLQWGCNSANINDLSPLIHKDGHSVIWAREIVSLQSLLSGAKPLGRKPSSGVYGNLATGASSSPEELTAVAMVGEESGLQQLDLLPADVSLPLRHALDKCRESPPTDWPAAAYVLGQRIWLCHVWFIHINTRNSRSKPTRI